jgi:D-alanyl-lipoteichoic acid acyltransferase DltB (MBOAT superfamily)
MLGLVGCSAAAPRESKHVSCCPTLACGFSAPTLHKIFLFFSSFLLQIVWASSHGIAASIGNAFVVPGALVSMDAQRRKRSVVNHCRQSINLAIVSFLEIYISLLCAADCPQLRPYCCLRTPIFGAMYFSSYVMMRL